MNDPSILEAERRKVVDHFRARAATGRLEMRPLANVRQLNLLDRLYEEYRGDRGIIIELDRKSSLSFDYLFTKSQRNSDQFQVVYISLADPENHLDKLWSIYRAWMHKGCSENDVEKACSGS